MATTSARSIRILGLDETFTTESLKDLCTRQSQTVEEGSKTYFLPRWFPSTSTPTSTCLGVSLAAQNGYKVATASFNDQSAKIRVFKSLKSAGWAVDDIFNDITVLHSPPAEDDVEIEYHSPLVCEYQKLTPMGDYSICAIHGLQGNAFDTWEAGNETRTSMWLRDYLPYTPPFKRARIMTFGYSSQVRDRQNVSDIRVWAKNLLWAVENVRPLAIVRYV
jgi:hypothetical protein